MVTSPVQLPAEFFLILVDGAYLVYAPLRQTAFLAKGLTDD